MATRLIPYRRDAELEGLLAEDARLRAEAAAIPPESDPVLRRRLEGDRVRVWDAIRRRKAWLAHKVVPV